MTLAEMKAKYAANADRMAALVKEHNDSWSDEQEKEWAALQEENTGLEAAIARQERVDGQQRQLSASAGRVSLAANQRGAGIGMSDGEVQRYSLVRAIRAAAEAPQNPRAWEQAGLELEASRAVAERLGMEPRGFFVPYDVMDAPMPMRADLTRGTNADGGYTVRTELREGNFIDLLRNRMIMDACGCTTLTGLVGDVTIPKQTAAATAYWVAESGAPTESQLTFGQVTLQPKTLGAFTDVSRKLLLQSSIDVEALVRSDITKVLALAIDLACIHGTGSNNQPLGLLADLDANLSDNIVAMGENGAAPTFAKMVELETMIAAGNADIGSLCYCTNPQVRGTLKTTEKDVTGNYPVYIWEPGNTVNGYRTEVSNQVSHTLTKGTSDSVCSAMMFGNWADCLLGLWGTLDLLVDPYTGATSGTVRVVALQSVDIVRRRLESFSAIVDLLTA